MLRSAQSALNRLQFELRTAVLGRVALRPGAPRIDWEQALAGSEVYRLLLEAAWSPEVRASVSWGVDVGCRNWSYLPTLSETFPHAGWTGVELDWARRFWNLYRRGDYAHAYARAARKHGHEAVFVPGDFLRLPGTLLFPEKPPEGKILFSFLFPFVSEDPCLGWGLPLDYSGFAPLLERAATAAQELGRDGMILSVHQGSWEGDLAARAYDALGIPFRRRMLPPQELGASWRQEFGIEVFSAELKSPGTTCIRPNTTC